MNNPLGKSFWRRLWKQERGFTLIEVVAAVFIMGTVTVGSVVVMGTATRASSDIEKNLELQQFVQAQIETIQNSPFDESGDYPKITGLPEEITVEVVVSDSGTNYQYPNPDGAMITNVVQKVTVTVCEGSAEEGCPEAASSVTGLLSMSVYKIEE